MSASYLFTVDKCQNGKKMGHKCKRANTKKMQDNIAGCFCCCFKTMHWTDLNTGLCLSSPDPLSFICNITEKRKGPRWLLVGLLSRTSVGTGDNVMGWKTECFLKHFQTKIKHVSTKERSSAQWFHFVQQYAGILWQHLYFLKSKSVIMRVPLGSRAAFDFLLWCLWLSALGSG